MNLQLAGCSTLTSQVGTNCEGFYSAGAASEEYAVNDSVKAAPGIGYSILEAAGRDDLIPCLPACLPACPAASTAHLGTQLQPIVLCSSEPQQNSIPLG